MRIDRVTKAVGEFYTELAQAIFGGDRVRGQNNGGGPDIINYRLDSCFEVKGSSIINRVKIFSTQLHNHLEMMGFPVARCLYVIFLYHNDRRRSITTQVRDDGDVRQYLVQNTRDLFVIDAVAVREIGLRFGSMQDRRDGKLAAMFAFRTRFLRTLRGSPQAFRRQFQLPSAEFPVRRYHRRLPGIHPVVAVTVLAPPAVQWRVRRAFAPHPTQGRHSEKTI